MRKDIYLMFVAKYDGTVSYSNVSKIKIAKVWRLPFIASRITFTFSFSLNNCRSTFSEYLPLKVELLYAVKKLKYVSLLKAKNISQ